MWLSSLRKNAAFLPNQKIKIKSSLYSPYYAETCNEWWGPSPRLSAWATQLRRNIATVASHWRHCVDLTGPGIEPQTSRTDNVRLATELTGLPNFYEIVIRCLLYFIVLCDTRQLDIFTKHAKYLFFRRNYANYAFALLFKMIRPIC